MIFKQVLSFFLVSLLSLVTGFAYAESQSDRANEGHFDSAPSQMLVEYLNHNLEATAAGKNMVDLPNDLNVKPVKFRYTGIRYQKQYSSMSAREYREAVFGSK